MVTTPERPRADEVIGIAAVCSTLNVSKGTVYNWVEKSILPKPLKYGRQIRWRAKDIHLWLAARDAAMKRRATETIDPQEIAEMAIRSLDTSASRRKPRRRAAIA
jgi:excisionase family DNA binding protein